MEETTVQEVTAKTEVIPLESDQSGEKETKSGTDEQAVETKDEIPDKEETKKEEKVPSTSDSTESVLKNEIAELRKFVREQRLKLAVMEEKQQVDKSAAEGQDEGENEEKPKQAKGVLTQLKEELDSLKTRKAESVDTMYEMMKLSPKYPDIESVVTTQRVSDIIEAAATALATEKNIPIEVAHLQVEKGIWESKNPYANIYGAIKEYHPDFTGKKEVKTSKKPLTSVPDTVITKGGSSTSGAGWTAAKIDAMPEDELKTIPKEIYQKYMRGELSK